MSEPTTNDPAATEPTTTPAASTAAQTQAAPTADPTAWMSGMGDAERAHLKTKGFTEPAHLYNAYKSLETHIGAPELTLKLPKAALETPEGKAQWDSIYDKLGRPAKPEDYGIKDPEGKDNTFADKFSKKFHELGLSKRQAEAITNEWNATSAEVSKQMQAKLDLAANQAVTELKAKWGNAFEQNMGIAKSVTTKFPDLISDESFAAIEQSLGVAKTVELFHQIMSKTGQTSKFETGQPQNFGTILSPGEAKSALNQLVNDKDFFERFSKGEAEAVNKFNKLTEQASSFSQ